jgi:hypothetical protein
MNKLLKLASMIMIIVSSSSFSHDGATDPRGGHNCEPLNAKKGLCMGYHKHSQDKALDAKIIVEDTGGFDYSQKSDYLTFNHYMKYKVIKENIDGNKFSSIVLMKRQTNREISRFSEFFLSKNKEQDTLNLYLQEQSTANDKFLIDANEERKSTDNSLKNKKPWGIYNKDGLSLNGLSLFEYKSLKFESANLDGEKIVSWIFGDEKVKYEIYEKDGLHTLASIKGNGFENNALINKKDTSKVSISLSTLANKTKAQTIEMLEEDSYFLFGGVGINTVEFWKDKKKVYSFKKIKERF